MLWFREGRDAGYRPCDQYEYQSPEHRNLKLFSPSFTSLFHSAYRINIHHVMHHKLHFIGWTRSLAESVSDYLLKDRSDIPFSLRDTIIVVPTAQSGRRLRHALARYADKQGTGVLTGAVITPFRLLNDRLADAGVDQLAETACWMDVLTSSCCRQLRALFPRLPKEVDFKWRRDAVDTLIKVRAQLAEAGLTESEVAASGLIHEAEVSRWRDVETLSDLVQARMKSLGLAESTQAQLNAASTALPPDGICNIVIAACPELAPLLQKLLFRWSEKIHIDIIVHAPPELAHTFNEWGCPKTDYWRNEAMIELEQCGASLLAVGSPKEQALAVQAVMEDHEEWAVNGGFAIGVPDESVTPYIVNTLQKMGCPCFDPAGISYRLHPIYQWLKSWRDLAVHRTYESLREFVRLAQVLDYLERAHHLTCAGLLGELDELQNECLPFSVNDVAAFVKGREGAFPSLSTFMPWLLSLLERDNVLLPDAMVEQLVHLYDGYLLAPGNPVDDSFIAVARHLVDAWSDQLELRKMFPAFKDNEWLDLLLESAGRSFFYNEARQDSVELEGWLELPWNDSPLMMVTGMNEGFVPDGRFEDMFLPDSIKEKLGLKSDASRCARDAYILCALNETRRNGGHLALIAGRASDRGDVLKPSRLFWRCHDEILLQRADAFFTSRQVHQVIPEKTFNINLVMAPPDERARQQVERRVWNVTDFAAYLGCPFRFYLNRKLEMEPVNDTADELDAMEFGKLVHGALEHFGKTKSLWSSDNPDFIAEALKDMVENAVRSLYGRRPPITVELQVQSAIQRLKAFARLHVEDFKTGWEIVAVEKKLVIKLDDVEIRGKIDRVDRHEDGRIRVLDYKTYDKVKSPEAVHFRAPRADDVRPYVAVTVTSKDKRGAEKIRERHWSDLQLPLYMKFLEEEFGSDARISAGYVLLTKAVSDVAIQLWDGLDVRLTGTAFECARGCIRDVAHGLYWPPLVAYANDQYDENWWPGFIDQVIPPVVKGHT